MKILLRSFSIYSFFCFLTFLVLVLVLISFRPAPAQERVIHRDAYGVGRHAPFNILNFDRSCVNAIQQALSSIKTNCVNWDYNLEKLIKRSPDCAEQGPTDECLLSLCKKRQFLLWPYVNVFVPVVCKE